MTIGKKIVVGFAVGLVALILVGVLTFWTTTRMADAVSALRTTNQVRLELETLQSLMKDAETGQRGFLLTGNKRYLAPYKNAQAKLDGCLDGLRELTRSDPAQQQRLDELKPLLDDKLAELAQTIELYNKQGKDAALKVVETDRGKDLMDEAGKIMKKMATVEDEKLETVTADANRGRWAVYYSILVGKPVVGIVLILACLYVVRSTTGPMRVAIQQLTSVGAELLAGTTEQAAGAQEQAAPCLFGVYTQVACLYSQLPRRYARVRAVDWAGKQDVTFSDAITAVRRWLWLEWVFAIPGYKPAFQKLSRPFRCLLLHALAPAA